MIWITKEHIILLHSDLIASNCGLDGVRDDGMLQSARLAPLQIYDGEQLFPTIIDKAARLAYGLVQNHPFIDGNKRIGAHAMLVVLALNGISLQYTQQELSTTFWKLASAELSFDELKEWIEDHIESNK